MIILRLLSLFKRLPQQGAPYAARVAHLPTCEDRAPSCGWFDSSHELQRGLQVQEHVSADTLGSELPLVSWLELQLSGWHVTSPT